MQYSTPPDKDPRLWQLAQRRASFKNHFAVYLVMSVFFWVLWYFTDVTDVNDDYESFVPWPVWPMAGWGVGVLFHYLGAYVFPQENSVEREYEKLKNQNNKHKN